MIVFEQGALDSLYLAKQELELAIGMYQTDCRDTELFLDKGPLYVIMERLREVQKEILAFQDIATK